MSSFRPGRYCVLSMACTRSSCRVKVSTALLPVYSSYASAAAVHNSLMRGDRDASRKIALTSSGLSPLSPGENCFLTLAFS